MDVDMTPPTFLENTPYFAWGPQVADYLKYYYDHQNDPHIHYGSLGSPQYFRNLTCNKFILVHAHDDKALPYPDDYVVQLDIRYGNVWNFTYITPNIGAGIWIDHDPLWNSEFDTTWPDTHPPLQNGLPNDHQWWGEEYITAIDVNTLMQHPPDELRVRITDFRDNWRRSNDLITGSQMNAPAGGGTSMQTQAANPSVIDLMFRDNLRYENPADPCYAPSNQSPYRRVTCDGYVAPRPGGECPLDVCAIVSDATPPDNIEVTVGAPNDEPNHESIQLFLYRLDYDACSTAWDEIWRDYTCEAGSVPTRV